MTSEIVRHSLMASRAIRAFVPEQKLLIRPLSDLLDVVRIGLPGRFLIAGRSFRTLITAAIPTHPEQSVELRESVVGEDESCKIR